MELTYTELDNRLRAIRSELVKGDLTDVSVEHPGYLSILFGEREYHAGYQFDDDINDTGLFEVYDFTDGYQGEVYKLIKPDMATFEGLAKWITNAVTSDMACQECPECGELSNDFRGDWCKACDKEGGK
jgi:hypothetical protein